MKALYAFRGCVFKPEFTPGWTRSGFVAAIFYLTLKKYKGMDFNMTGRSDLKLLKLGKDIFHQSGVPLYIQLAAYLRRKVESGEWPTGAKLPSLEALSEVFDVSRVTIRQAIQLLVSENYIVSKQGKGTFVAALPSLPPREYLQTSWEGLIRRVEGTSVKIISEEDAEACPFMTGDGLKADSGYRHMWLEEPLRCNTHVSQWLILRDHSSVPLAGGENIRGEQAFQKTIASRALGVLQPDVCKWGGITHCRAVAQEVLNAGLRYCPHYLGGGIGLLASAHILASVGGDGLLEVDINPNPLRNLLAQPHPLIREGRFCLNDTPGLGAEPDLTQLAEMTTFHGTRRRRGPVS